MPFTTLIRRNASKVIPTFGIAWVVFAKMFILFNLSESKCTGPPEWNEIFEQRSGLPADHPKVLRYLHTFRLHPPPPIELQLPEYRKRTTKRNLSKIFELIKAGNGGFFIECGANDGEFLSNTLQLEKEFGWTGLLIEASPSLFQKLLSRGRNAWTANVCLSGSIERTEFKMNFNTSKNWMQGTGLIDPGKKYKAPLYDPYGLDTNQFTSEGVIDCFPLTSLLAAIGRRTIDYFTLDTQGHEFQILKTVPFHELNIKVLVVEYIVTPEGKEAIRKLMELSGYKMIEDNGIDYTFQNLRIFE